jgi:predicted HicB family RNase H-like nuclease
MNMKIKPRETKPKKVMYSQRIREDLVRQVQKKARKENVSIAEIIEAAFQEYLETKIF